MQSHDAGLAEMRAKTQMVTELRSENAALRADNVALRSEVATLRDELSALRRTVQGLSQEERVRAGVLLWRDVRARTIKAELPVAQLRLPARPPRRRAARLPSLGQLPRPHLRPPRSRRTKVVPSRAGEEVRVCPF